MGNAHHHQAAEDNSLTSRTDRIAERLAAIVSAKPVCVQAPPPKPDSKRKEPRQPVYRHGKLTIAGGAVIDCIINDVSPNGARVELDGAESLPEFVVLKTVMTGEIKRARVSWRRGNAAGLSFLVGHRIGFGNSKL